jgi:hypothetical protein
MPAFLFLAGEDGRLLGRLATRTVASRGRSRPFAMRQRWRAVKLSRLNDSKSGMIHVVP